MMMSLPISDLRSYSLITLTLPANYGYCILVAVGSMFVLEGRNLKIEKSKKISNLAQPGTYSESVEVLNKLKITKQKTLERYPQFLTLLLLGGLESPVVSAVGGALCLVGSIVNTLDYCNEDTRKLVHNAFGSVGCLAMMASTTKLALRLLLII